jgi:hypothetical protein
MHVKLIKQYGSWVDVINSARISMGKEDTVKEPSNQWKKNILLSGHTPIREIEFIFVVTDIPYWIVMHFVRHHEGIIHTVSTQRTDRTGIQREKLPQDTLVKWRFRVNADAMINISRKRLCVGAGYQVIDAWSRIIFTLRDIEPVLYSVLVPECVYRGRCYEFLKPCGYSKTNEYQEELNKYRKIEVE